MVSDVMSAEDVHLHQICWDTGGHPFLPSEAASLSVAAGIGQRDL